MRALVQRVTEAAVRIDGSVVGEIGPGLVILACAMQGDGPDEALALAGRIAKLRIFRDADQRMNLSVTDQGGSVLIISQFTLAADTSRGNRPGFSQAAAPNLGAELVETLATELARLGLTVARGRFGADMKVSLVNDGPVTIWLDTAERKPSP
ncbi:D-tyrosyl-tRNA(Tyr) deacylase [Silicimonas algicola]|uniref:D-aminoacyl-tRNA deacylase n=1 Tax=Silicimonas algicola TaxID=1826607 RepID=A0A316G8H0_9RHOB|nr:D-aminoacyl-tRNA deacylase [Silicimonas algicola]AZQ67545.1 D-tyrosyl-tRNA(Tyr) deacylase [Silicimonas algicola]PWK57244.1 D-tyrosyl-tRNA(Tyr) deacylase [Silicimonas algicola]